MKNLNIDRDFLNVEYDFAYKHLTECLKEEVQKGQESFSGAKLYTELSSVETVVFISGSEFGVIFTRQTNLSCILWPKERLSILIVNTTSILTLAQLLDQGLKLYISRG